MGRGLWVWAGDFVVGLAVLVELIIVKFVRFRYKINRTYFCTLLVLGLKNKSYLGDTFSVYNISVCNICFSRAEFFQLSFQWKIRGMNWHHIYSEIWLSTLNINNSQ